PLMMINPFASLGRVFMFSQWLPKSKVNNNFAKKLIAYFIIPAIFLGLFLIVYSFGSDHFSSLFTDYTLDIDILEFMRIACFGFFIAFTFWNYWIPEASYEFNSKLDNDFTEKDRTNTENTFS